MKKQKRFLAMLVALAMCLSLLPAGVVRAEQAEGASGDASSVYEPWAHGYRFVDILNCLREKAAPHDRVRRGLLYYDYADPVTVKLHSCQLSAAFSLR